MDEDRIGFEERAAWLEFCDGMHRFQAESIAARELGKQRWELLNVEIERGSGEE